MKEELERGGYLWCGPKTFPLNFLDRYGDNSFLYKINFERVGGMVHKNIKTTERYTHVTRNAVNRIKSPLDRLELKDE